MYNGVAGCYKLIARRPMTYSFERQEELESFAVSLFSASWWQ